MVSFSGADTSAVGGNADSGGASTTVTYPGVTMTVGDGTSWIVSCGGHRSVDTSIDTDGSVPTGLSTTNKIAVTDATDEAVCWNSNAGVASFSNSAISVGGTSSGWRAKTVEILVPSTFSPVDPMGISGFFGL